MTDLERIYELISKLSNKIDNLEQKMTKLEKNTQINQVYGPIPTNRIRDNFIPSIDINNHFIDGRSNPVDLMSQEELISFWRENDFLRANDDGVVYDEAE